MRLFFRFTILAVMFCVASTAAAGASLLTHSTDFARVAPEQWRAEAWRVASPDPSASVVTADGAVAFVVATPNTAMAWTLSTEPIWTEPFATLALSYFVEGSPAADSGAFIEVFDGSTGPITPGATNNENPLASGGRYAFGVLDPGLHVRLVELDAAENLDRVADITVTVRSGLAPVAVRFNQMAFLARPQPAAPVAPMIRVEGGAASTRPVSLSPEARTNTKALAVAHGLAPDAIRPGDLVFGGVSFGIGEYAALTPLDKGGVVTLKVEDGGSAIALLLSTRLWGSGQAWYSGVPPARGALAQADPFRGALHYADGTITVAQPLETVSGKPGLQRGLAAYIVPLNPEKQLAQVVLAEDMSYGQTALIAASILDAPFASGATAIPRTRPAPAQPRPDPEGSTLLLETPKLRLSMDRNGVVHSFQIGESRRELASRPFELATLIQPDGAAYPLQFVEALRVPEGSRMLVLWSVGDGSYQFELSLEVRDDGGLVCTPTLANLSVENWSPWAVAPRVTDLRVDQGGTTEYILGSRSALQDTAPIDVAEIYGGQFPLQFMDAYDQDVGGGLAYMVLDETLTRKWFEFKQDEAGLTTMAVSYRNLAIAPGERLALPPTVLLPHEGDWRAPFQEYKAWVRQRFPRDQFNGMRDVFYCRRDYPLGGTTYLYDPAKREYTFGRLISESQWAFGGADLIDISGWAYNEQVGRVGTYLKNDLGGLDGLATGVASAHARGVQVGLYFEGYLLDKRAANAERGLADWQLVRAGGEPAWWPGEMEFFCCPGAKGWRDALASDIAEVARVTGADAVYVDQLGILDTGKECWAAHHGHPVPSNPIVEEIALLKRVREELDRVRPACAIYIEHIPCDAMTPYIDGAFNLGMKHTRNAMGPTKLPLHRYLNPDVPVFEMVAHGIRPIPAEEDDLKLSFFHGMGLWLKGKGASWYSQGFRQLAPQFHDVLVEHRNYFRSPEALPHVDTLMSGVYANKFPHAGKAVYTLYNANPVSVEGPLLKLEGATGAAPLLDIAPFETLFDAGTETLTGTLPPHGVMAVLVAW